MTAVTIEEGAESTGGSNFLLIGIGVGILGLLGAAYLGWFQIRPALDKKAELEQKLAELELQIQQGATLDQQIEQANREKAIAEEQKARVTALFADEKNLDTLLLDINRIVESRQASMSRFQPSQGGPELITDGSLGELVNGKLKRQEIQMEFTGTFEETRSVLLTMERLQPLLVVKRFRTQADRSTQEVRFDRGQIAISGAPELTTSLTIEALLPAALPPATPTAPE